MQNFVRSTEEARNGFANNGTSNGGHKLANTSPTENSKD